MRHIDPSTLICIVIVPTRPSLALRSRPQLWYGGVLLLAPSSGSLDTQSWFHSQEVNVMIDSPTIMKEWRAGLDANQNTLRYGQVCIRHHTSAIRQHSHSSYPKVQYDGIWRDHEGQPLKDAAGPGKGGFVGTLKGLKGAVDRVRGTGGF